MHNQMPMPTKGQSRNKYLNKAIPMMMKEGLTQKQAVGKAEGMFTHYTKGGKPKKENKWHKAMKK